MQILHPNSPDKFQGGQSIFLAGPTPRSPEVMSWRPLAIDLLQKAGFDGTVFVPERTDWSTMVNYDDQVEWEWAGLEEATVIAFWVPRELKTMPAYTTNVEFGLFVKSVQTVYGRPPNAPKTRYLDQLYRRWHGGRSIHEALDTLMDAAVNLANFRETN
jgi:hypothetical protein